MADNRVVFFFDIDNCVILPLSKLLAFADKFPISFILKVGLFRVVPAVLLTWF
jgi:hypothetical protein